MKKSIISGILAGLTFIIFQFFLRTTFILSVVMGTAVYIGASIIFGEDRAGRKPSQQKQSKDKTKKPEINTEDINQDQLGEIKQIIEKGESKVKNMRALKSKISDFEVRGKIESIAKSLDKIFNELRSDPGDVKKAKKALGYYLDTTIQIIEKYINLSKHRNADPKIAESLQRVERMLDMLNEAFEKQLAQLLENNVMDLDVEMEVLEQNLKMRGL